MSWMTGIQTIYYSLTVIIGGFCFRKGKLINEDKNGFCDK